MWGKGRPAFRIPGSPEGSPYRLQGSRKYMMSKIHVFPLCSLFSMFFLVSPCYDKITPLRRTLNSRIQRFCEGLWNLGFLEGLSSPGPCVKDSVKDSWGKDPMYRCIGFTVPVHQKCSKSIGFMMPVYQKCSKSIGFTVPL